jgi:hypothetical protein
VASGPLVGSISNSSVSSDVIEAVIGRKETVSESAAFSNAIMSGEKLLQEVLEVERPREGRLTIARDAVL